MATIKLYHRDAELLAFTAQVQSCTPVEGGYAVTLDQTAFYATAGGQPHDTGRLGDARVLNVEEDETGTITHLVTAPLAGQVTGYVDPDRRWDHTQQHSGQHLLSQAFVEVLDAETVSFHLGEESSTIDLEIENLTPEQVAEVERRANQVVQENRPVHIHWANTLAEVERFPLRRPPKVAENIRIVEIAGFDWSACGGTHVAATGQLGLVKVKGWERHKKGVRVTYLAGLRAVADYQALDQMVREVCRGLSIGVRALPDWVDRTHGELSALRKQLKQARDALLEREAAELVSGARRVGSVRVVQMQFSGRGVEELRGLAIKIAAQPQTVALLGLKSAVPQLVFARSADVRHLDMGAVLREVLPLIGGKGGGSPVQAQGAGTKSEGVALALEAAGKQVSQFLG
jgi:alanyl-tRNA synthetase